MDTQSKLVELDTRISEAKQLLSELEGYAHVLRDEDKHTAVEELENYFESSELDLKTIGPFRDEILQELKALIEKLKALATAR